MKLNEQQLNRLSVVNESIVNEEFDNDSFLDALEELSNDGVDVEKELRKRYGTEL